VSETTTDVDQLTYPEAWERIGELADDLLNHDDPEVAQRVEELLDWVDWVHREGLGRLTEMIRQWRGELFLDSAGRDEVVGLLFTAYGLGEAPEEVRAQAAQAVETALQEIRPYAESHGGTIELENIVDGVVTVRMMGSCDGCPSSSATLSHGVEEALRKHWPDFRRLEVVDPAAGNGSEDDAHAHAHAAAPQPETLLQIRGHEGA
jgi:Fe-S cluster biogenesis protein NfuA